MTATVIHQNPIATTPTVIAAQRPKKLALEVMAERFNCDPGKLYSILCNTVIKPTDRHTPTQEEVAAFVIVANEYRLNPFTREIHAFADPRKGVIPIVGIDGWTKIVNSHESYDGVEFDGHVENGVHAATTCIMYVKGRSHPVKVTEWLKECRRPTDPWMQMPRRMLRHKAYMQAARLAFGISGIHDEDEARDMVYMGPPAPEPTSSMVAKSRADSLESRLTGQVLPTTPESVSSQATEPIDATNSSEPAQASIDPTVESDAPPSAAPQAEPSSPPADPGAPRLHEQAAILLAEKAECGDDVAIARLQNFAAKVYGNDQLDQLTTAQQSDLLAQVRSGAISVPKRGRRAE